MNPVTDEYGQWWRTDNPIVKDIMIRNEIPLLKLKIEILLQLNIEKRKILRKH
jgi:hypothetical protein